MTREEFVKQQFLTLREEIRESKARMFKLLILGSLFIPAASVAANYSLMQGPRAPIVSDTEGSTVPAQSHGSSALAISSLPFLVLVIMFAFVMEQNSIIRAGRYLREQVEPQVRDIVGWEQWLESQKQHRAVDRAFVSSFLAVYLVFYAVTTGAAIETLVNEYRDYYGYAAVGYAVGGLWFIIVFLRHWRSCTSTAA